MDVVGVLLDVTYVWFGFFLSIICESLDELRVDLHPSLRDTLLFLGANI
jgi:hypothetical protein